MKDTLRNKLQVIIARYEKLGLDTELYQMLIEIVKDEEWLEKHSQIMEKVTNSEKIFDISKEINANKNDVRVDEAFAELDTAKNLATTGFYGKYDTVTYEPPQKDKRWPDILAENSSGITPVEVKLLTPEDLSETKFFQKFIDKVNNHAIPQLSSYYNEQPFTHAYVFVWSYKPVPLQKLEYGELRKWVDEKVDRPEFDVTLLSNFYRIGMWDFPIKRKIGYL